MIRIANQLHVLDLRDLVVLNVDGTPLLTIQDRLEYLWLKLLFAQTTLGLPRGQICVVNRSDQIINDLPVVSADQLNLVLVEVGEQALLIPLYLLEVREQSHHVIVSYLEVVKCGAQQKCVKVECEEAVPGFAYFGSFFCQLEGIEVPKDVEAKYSKLQKLQ